jgi:hypothetical protein
MRKLLVITALLLFAGIAFGQNKADIEKNKRIATLYHQLNAGDVDIILTEDYIGGDEQRRRSWNREDHRNFLSNGIYKKDSILNQVAEGDWVATRFVRTMDWNGKIVSVEAMQFKRFEKGKISEIWEYADPSQIESEEE